MSKLFAPAIVLLDRLRYPQKFALISLIFVLPLGLAFVLLMSEFNSRIAFSEKELVGNAYLRPLRALMEHVSAAQMLTAQAAQGDSTAQAALPAAQDVVNADMAALGRIDQEHGPTLATGDRYNNLKAIWEQLQQEQQSLSIVSSQPRYDQFIRSLGDIRAYVGDTSNLVLDPDLDTYYLMNAILQTLPEEQDLLLQLELDSAQFGDGSGTDYQRAHLFEVLTLLRSSNDTAQRGLQTALANSASPTLKRTLEPLVQQMYQTSDNYITRTRVVIGANAAQRAVQRKDGQAALAASFKLWDRASVELDTLIQKRVDGFVQKQYTVAVFAVVALTIVLYLLIGFYRSVMGMVSQLEHTAQRLVNGESPEAVALNTRDELGQVAVAFNQVATALIESGAQRRAVVEHAADGILTLDQHARIRSFNPAAAHIFGYTASEAIGLDIAQLIPEYATINQQGLTRQETTGQRKDQTTFALDVTLSKTALGDQQYTVVIVRDITERKQAEAERERLHEAIIQGQAAALEQLATPLIPVTDQTVVMPLVGSVDTQRAEQIVAALLRGIEAHHARVAILDITGVPVVDTHVARTILQAARAAELLGARTVITGIRPEVAATLVTLGVDLRSIATRSTLQSAIALALTLETQRQHQFRAA